MTPRPDLNILAKEVYEANKLKGFHDKERSNETLLMLVITELSEAVEADRKGKRANTDRLLKRIETSRSYKGLIPDITPERAYEVIYNETIKGSIEEELADAVIRLLDLAGLRGYEFKEPTKEWNKAIDNYMEYSFPFSFIIFMITGRLYILYQEFVNDAVVIEIISAIEHLCKLMDIDLWLHVELKLKYNQSRPFKHGKGY